MKLLLLLGLLSCSQAFAVDFRCTRGNRTLSFQVGAHSGAGPTLYALRLDGGGDPHEEFKKILIDSKKCSDLKNYVMGIEQEEALLCKGEMFAPNGAYDQVILTKGGIEVFKCALAPRSGWKCN
ncbi:MAG: hypothetical protein AB1540_13875 [Bdellovibrionota bacterium]